MLIIYDLKNHRERSDENRKYIDHGPIFYEDGTRPTYVNSIAIGKNGNVYTLGRFEYKGKVIEDLVKIPDPF